MYGMKKLSFSLKMPINFCSNVRARKLLVRAVERTFQAPMWQTLYTQIYISAVAVIHYHLVCVIKC